MRKRSNTVYANSIEELTAKLSNTPVEKGRSLPQRNLASNIKRIQTKTEGSHEKKSVKNEDKDWAEFDFNNDTSPVLRQTPFSSNANGMEIEEPASPLVTKKLMVIGSRGAGKHFAVNSAFRSQDGKEATPLQQTMDFILKTEEQGSQYQIPLLDQGVERS